MKNRRLLILLSLAYMLSGCNQKSNSTQSESVMAYVDHSSPDSDMKRGEYLVNIMGCNDCHTPKVMTSQGPVPDPQRILSGYPATEPLVAVRDRTTLQNYALFNMDLTATIGPWGTSFSANLTPDETGLGNWTYQNFELALRQGKYKGLENGRTLLPPMPWQNYKWLTDSDTKAIWVYLQSIPPVKNMVPAPSPPAE